MFVLVFIKPLSLPRDGIHEIVDVVLDCYDITLATSRRREGVRTHCLSRKERKLNVTLISSN